MARTIRCTEAQRTLDLEVDPNCDFVARTETEDEALAEFTDHMQTVHNWNEIFEPDLVATKDGHLIARHELFEPDLEKVRVQIVHNDV